jgi:hypothetical protein
MESWITARKELLDDDDWIAAEVFALYAVLDAARAWDENADNLSHDAIERVLTDALDAYHREQDDGA